MSRDRARKRSRDTFNHNQRGPCQQMLRFVVRRFLLLIPILLGLSILVFFWIRALPGSPAQALLGERATPQTIRDINHEYGLDKPVWVQYWSYLKETAQLHLGTSITTRVPVLTEISQRFPATVELAVAAAFFAIASSLMCASSCCFSVLPVTAATTLFLRYVKRFLRAPTS